MELSEESVKQPKDLAQSGCSIDAENLLISILLFPILSGGSLNEPLQIPKE